MRRRPERNRCDRALEELQVTLNIACRNSLEDENDTWVLFSDQYLDLVHALISSAIRCRTRLQCPLGKTLRFGSVLLRELSLFHSNDR
jgi:hypothetical protein